MQFGTSALARRSRPFFRAAGTFLSKVRRPGSDAGLRGSDVAGLDAVRLLVIGASCRGGGIRAVVMEEPICSSR